ncbi:MAG: bifunctional riboflavin kinase/FAD synthetase [Methylobacteriaceae bacterium]|nr:bifunctional riboflavin kinase/FAD synthetase [Methylobacteriaceae bacterium]
MARIRDGEAVPERFRGSVVALGNFDGVHRGHQKLVATAQEIARATSVASAVLTFDPHPRDFFAPDKPRFSLTDERAKLKIFSWLGLDVVFIKRFDGRLAATGAADFVTGTIGRDLGASGIVVGPNFFFGRGRQGSPQLLADLACRHGLGCSVADTVEIEGAPVSSTRIRAALERGDVASANAMLGYRWFVSGEVEHGRKLGRTLGYPTANLALGRGCRLRHGIYAVRVALGPGDVRDAVASFGSRPTFDDGAPLLEIHLFDFAGDLYGREIEAEFVGWIRGEERFASAEALVAQMDRDSEQARALLAQGSEMPSLIG